MAQLSGALITYDDAIRREDLLDVIADVSPDQNYLSTTLKTSVATQTSHEWGDYNTSRPTSNAAKAQESDDASFSDLTKITRKTNICQIINEYFAVSGTESEVDKAGPKDAYAREMAWAMRRWKNKLEYAVLRGTKASGASGVAREMNGIRNFVVDDGLSTTRTTFTSLSETEFNNMIAWSWGVTDEYVVDLCLTTASRKRDISAFTAGNTKNIPADDKRLVNAISVYESDFGIVECRAHKDMASNEVLLVRKENLAIAYLRKPKHTELAKTGDSKKGMINGEATTEVRAGRSMVLQMGFNQN